jgi:uncharacterized damage-inducible protein DinB
VNHDELTLLLDYHYWARDRVLAAVAPLSREQYTQTVVSSFRSVRDTVVHTYAAEWIWHRRWHGESPTALIPGDRFADLEAIRRAWTELEREVRGDLAALDGDGLTAIVNYRLLSGMEGATPFWQILQHVVNHASYHRGQVTTLLRQLGTAPPESMDLITFYRTTPERRG